MGKTHAQAYESLPHLEITGVVDSIIQGKSVMLPSGREVPLFSTLHDAFQTVFCNVVDLCVPTDLHLSLGLEVLKNKKNLFCEKPIALSVVEAKILEEARQEAGVQAMVGHCIRFWPEYRFLANVIQDKPWGELKVLSLRRYAARPRTTSQNWVADPTRCMGAALDLHIHDTDFILSVLGLPTQVSSRGVQEASGWNWIATDYHYGETAVRAEGGWNLPASWAFEMSYRAVFEGGVIDYNSSRDVSVQLSREKEFPVLTFGTEEPKAAVDANQNLTGLSGYVETLKYFIHCVQSGQEVKEATLTQASDSLRVTLAEIQSAQSGIPTFI